MFLHNISGTNRIKKYTIYRMCHMRIFYIKIKNNILHGSYFKFKWRKSFDFLFSSVLSILQFPLLSINDLY